MAGSAFSPVGLAFAALDLTRSTADLGDVLAAGVVPRLLFLLIGGVVADRWTRTAVLAATSLGCAAAEATGVIVLLTGTARIWELIAIAAVIGTASAFSGPAGQGIAPLLVDQAQLQRATSVIQTLLGGCYMIGSGLAGLLVAGAGPAWAIGVDAISFAAAAPLWLCLRLPSRCRTPAHRMIRELREGWTAFRSRTWLWAVVLQCAVLNVGYWVGGQLLGPVQAQRAYGGAGSWGLMVSTNLAGFVLGGFMSLRFKPRRLLLAGVCCALGIPLPFMLLATVAPLWLVLTAELIAGTAEQTFAVAWATTMQQHLPEDLLSRSLSYDLLGSELFVSFGYLLGGPLASAAGIPAALWGCSALIVAPTVLVLLSPEVRRLEQTG